MQPLTHSLDALGTGLRVIDRVRRHPGWIAAVAAGLILVTPRRLSALFRLGSAGLRTWRSIAPSLQMLTMRRD